jgi:hypothetical protein
MPKLKFVVGCERVIIDRDGPASIIAIFEKMRIQLQEAPLPPKAISPSRWHIFSLWENEPSEAGQEFTQVAKVYAPDGEVFIEHEQTFKIPDAGNTQVRINIMLWSLPISMEGTILVKAWLKGSEELAQDFKFTVEYIKKGEHVTSS